MTIKEKTKKEGSLTEEEWKIVELRLRTMPDKMKLGILSKSYTKEELLSEVQDKSDVGRAYVEMQMEFLRWLIKQSIHQTQPPPQLPSGQ
jgi:predicted metalloprotease with PDZ domain